MTDPVGTDAATPAGVDLDALRTYFADHVEGATGAPLHASLIQGGRSNLTYIISDGSHEWILRRPPLGHVLPTAHDMTREHRILAALTGTDVPVPRPLALCEDESVNGAPFYVMEKVDGVVLRSAAEASQLSEQEARTASEALIEVLARIHSFDWESAGLEGWGHPDGYLERQVRRWGQQWERSKTRELPALDELVRRLRAALPESGPAAIVHGDYRFDNTMLTPDYTAIAAVLDWEMATLGDPLADMGLLLVYWADRNGASRAQISVAQGVTSFPGFFTRDEVIEQYAKRSGRAVDDLDWYVVFGFYKLAVIIEGIHARYLQGKTLGEGFEAIGAGVVTLVDSALEVAGRSSIAALRG
jgi:aminoglycoside phosphotransferase (APT) family kinase protein